MIADNDLKRELRKVAETPKLKLLLNDWEFCIKKAAFGAARPEIIIKKYKLIPSSKVVVPVPLQTADVLADEVVK